MNSSDLDRGKELVRELASLLGTATDSEIRQILDKNTVAALLSSILDTSTWQWQQGSFGDFLLQHRNRAALLASIGRKVRNSFRMQSDSGDIIYVTPHSEQWVDDGIILVEGPEFFRGEMVLWRNGQVFHAVLARAVKAGMELVPEDFEFITQDEYNERLTSLQRGNPDDLTGAIEHLQQLLSQRSNDESKYQTLFQEHPWMFGGRYSAVESHVALDDENIPDFTAVRVHDSERDILEIKPPFMENLFKSNGSQFGAEFNDAWNQVERYLRFAWEQRHYLRDKGLLFNNPKCYLLVGYDLTPKQLDQLRMKGRMNPPIEIVTYNDVIAMAQNVVNLALKLKGHAETIRGDTTLFFPPMGDQGLDDPVPDA